MIASKGNSNEILYKQNTSEIINIAGYGNGVQTDGVAEYFNVAHNAVFNTQTFSIATIIQFIAPNFSAGYRMFGKGKDFVSPTVSRTFLFFWQNNILYLDTNLNTTNSARATCALNNPTGKIYHLVANFDGGNVNNFKAYINGVPQTMTITSTGFTGIQYNAFPLWFNVFDINGTPQYYSQMRYYDVKMFDKTLSDAEVLQLFESENTNLTGLHGNRIGDWRFNEKEGNSIADFSANNLNLSMFNYTGGEIALGALNKHVDWAGNPILF